MKQLYKHQDFILLIRYHSPTNSRGSRYSIISKRLNKRITLAWDYSLNQSLSYQVKSYLEVKEIQIISWGEFGSECIFMIAWDDGINLFKRSSSNE